MASKLPCIIPKSIDCSGIFVNDYRKFFVKEEIGQDSFSSVYTANVPSDAGQGEKVLINKLLRQDREIKKFVKEARMLQIWKHANIVILKGIGNAPFALVMEYVFFDFAPFGGRNKVSSLEGFVSYVDCFDCQGFDNAHLYKKSAKTLPWPWSICTAKC